MAVIRVPEEIHSRAHEHLFSRPGEHFAFLHARTTVAAGEPVFLVQGATLVRDEHVTVGEHGWEIDPDILLAIVNDAVRSGDALVEVHNHGGAMPRPSRLDRAQYAEFVPYILDSLSGRPYAATVWADSTIYGEFFFADGTAGALRSITSIGIRLQQLVSRDDDNAPTETRYHRQLPWFTAAGQQQLARLRFGLVGAGGTGSHIALQLPYLGARDVLIVDSDAVDDTSGNRTVTATPADIDTPKAIVARRAVKSVAPGATVDALVADLRESRALDALKGVDVILGCVDNDGARLVLNELAVAYGIPYFDLAVGIDADDGAIEQAGGRLAVVLPGGPCLLCMDEIDRIEARYFLSTPEQQADQRERGYVTGMDIPAPSVVSLNATVASLALNELALYLSGARLVNPLTELDLLGVARPLAAQWAVPQRITRNPGCVTCTQAWLGDASGLSRYAI
jgi:molybdopterin/thiamine biosynthesis adenylyltransferase/proteasome lid subunit RPN8/RPN11